MLIVVVTLSMAVTPLLVSLCARITTRPPRDTPPYDAFDGEAPRVIIAGFGRIGQIVARVLRANHIAFTAIEHSIEQVEVSRRFGSKIHFGDPARAELLRSANIEKAEVLVIATDNPDTNIRIARLVRRQYPHVKVFARARNRQHVFRLMDMDVEVVRETFHSSLVLSREVLTALGLDPDVAGQRVQRFREYDEKLLAAQHLVYDDETAIMQSTRDALVDLDHLFEADSAQDEGANP